MWQIQINPLQKRLEGGTNIGLIMYFCGYKC